MTTLTRMTMKRGQLSSVDKNCFVSALKKNEDAENKPTPEQDQELGSLIAHLRTRFQDRLKEVRLSSRLEDSASVLVSDEGDLGPHLEQLLQRAGRKITVQKPILELNPKSTLVQKLAHLPPDTRIYCSHEYTLAAMRTVTPETAGTPAGRASGQRRSGRV